MAHKDATQAKLAFERKRTALKGYCLGRDYVDVLRADGPAVPLALNEAPTRLRMKCFSIHTPVSTVRWCTPHPKAGFMEQLDHHFLEHVGVYFFQVRNNLSVVLERAHFGKNLARLPNIPSMPGFSPINPSIAQNKPAPPDAHGLTPSNDEFDPPWRTWPQNQACSRPEKCSWRQRNASRVRNSQGRCPA